MNFRRIAQDEKVPSSGYQGLIHIKYPELCAIFGQPDKGSMDGKAQAQWKLDIAHGCYATIYDYKESQPARELMLWHVGGKSKDAVQLVELIIKEHRKVQKKLDR